MDNSYTSHGVSMDAITTPNISESLRSNVLEPEMALTLSNDKPTFLSEMVDDARYYQQLKSDDYNKFCYESDVDGKIYNSCHKLRDAPIDNNMNLLKEHKNLLAGEASPLLSINNQDFKSPLLIHCDDVELLSKHTVNHQRFSQYHQHRYHKYPRDNGPAYEQTMMKTSFSSGFYDNSITKNSEDSSYLTLTITPIDSITQITPMTPIAPIPSIPSSQQDFKLSMTDETSLYLRKRRLILDTPFYTRSIISYGFIVYANDTSRWAIIQRKHSVDFLLFIRGLYRLTYLPMILSCITDDEALKIYRCLRYGLEIFKTLYLEELGLSSDGLEYALIRMAESRNVVSNLLPKLNLTKNNLSWTWPKGRLHISSVRESPFECAKREFTEEVEIILPSPLYISDTYVSENIRTITGRNIESRYWIYIIPNEIPMESPKCHPEVSNRIWADSDQCRKLVRHDNLFQQVINMVSVIN